MRYFCTTPKHLEEVFALPRMLMIKTLLAIWDNTSALVPTHTMIARSTLSWWTREREKERKRVMHELAAIMVCVFHGIALYSIVFHGFRLSNLTFRIHVGSSPSVLYWIVLRLYQWHFPAAKFSTLTFWTTLCHRYSLRIRRFWWCE